MFNGSIVSYPNRGNYGSSAYRGNTTGLIVKDFLESYHKEGLFVDPAKGSDTSGDVAKEMRLNYVGLDLKEGFNLCRNNLKEEVKKQKEGKISTIFFHPPYHDMIAYSGNMWGEKKVKEDLSNCSSIEVFLEEMQLAIANIYNALSVDGIYGVLIGNLRRNGEYYPLTDWVRSLCLGKYKDEIIKIQHNCWSDKVSYSGSFVPIKHEKLYVFQKTKKILLALLDVYNFHKTALNLTWKNIIRTIFLVSNEKTLDLSTIYGIVEKSYKEKFKNNSNWQSKVRQTLQDEKIFKREERGLFSLA